MKNKHELHMRTLINDVLRSSIALTTDTSVITAMGNDSGFTKIFARQIKAQGKPGDVFMVFRLQGIPGI
jgi:phosphoheptose isomerase